MVKKVLSTALLVWGLASLFFMYEFFLQVFLATISNQLMKELHMDASGYSIINSGYFLSYSLMQIPVGILVDRFGARHLLTIAVATAATGVFWFSRIHSFEYGLISRFFMGFGSSFAYVSLLVLAMNWFPKKHFGLMIGIANFLGTMGPFLAGGPLSLLLYLFNNNWRLILLFISMLGFVLTFCIGIFLRNSPERDKGVIIHLDPYQEKWSIRMKLLLHNRQAWIIVVFSALTYLSLPLLGAYWGTGYLQARGLSRNTAATVSSVLWIGYAVGSPLMGKLSDQIKRRKPVLIFCALIGFLATLAVLSISTNHILLFMCGFFCIGIASSSCSLGFALISEHVQKNMQATAMGLNNSIIMFFATIFPPIIGFLIEFGVKNPEHIYTVKNYETGLILMPIFYALSLVLSLFFIKESFCRSQYEVIRVNIN